MAWTDPTGCKPCPDLTPLTKWPDVMDFTLLCVGVPNVAGESCWVKAIHFDSPEGGRMLSVWPEVSWVGSGDPGHWHVANH